MVLVQGLGGTRIRDSDLLAGTLLHMAFLYDSLLRGLMSLQSWKQKRKQQWQVVAQVRVGGGRGGNLLYAVRLT